MIEGLAAAFEMETALPAAAVVVPVFAERLSAHPESGGLPFSLFCNDEARVRAWRRLESAASLPMQSHAFASALATTLLAGCDIQVFSVERGDEIDALLALCRGSGRLARWTMIGAHEVSEPGDALCRDDEAAGRLAEAIVGDGRALEADRLPAGSPLVPALRSAVRGRGLMAVRPAIPSPTIALDSSWSDPASRFNAGRRSDFRRAARRAADHGEVSFEIVSPGPDEFDALFDEAIAVEARSWKREAGTAIAVDRAKENCFRHYFRSACEGGTFRIAFMRIDGKAVAMQMALETLDRYWLFKIGFDEAYERCSPGTLLMLHSLGWAAQRRLRAFELLGNVEPWIARFWTREAHDCVCVRIYPFNASGALAFAADAMIWLRRRLLPASA